MLECPINHGSVLADGMGPHFIPLLCNAHQLRSPKLAGPSRLRNTWREDDGEGGTNSLPNTKAQDEAGGVSAMNLNFKGNRGLV